MGLDLFLVPFPGAPKVRALAGVVVTFTDQAHEGVSSPSGLIPEPPVFSLDAGVLILSIASPAQG